MIVIGVPATSNLGPGIAPSFMARLMSNATSFREPISLTVVVPASNAFRMFVTARILSRPTSCISAKVRSCASTVALQCMWQCASIRPGISDTSPKCNTVPSIAAASGSLALGKTSAMRPSSIRTAWSVNHPVMSALATRLAVANVGLLCCTAIIPVVVASVTLCKVYLLCTRRVDIHVYSASDSS